MTATLARAGENTPTPNEKDSAVPDRPANLCFLNCDPNDPAAVHRATCLALSQTYFAHGSAAHDAAGAVKSPDLRDTLEDAAGVLFALSHALRLAADGSARGLDELAAVACGWLGEQRVEAMGGAKLSDLAANPEHN